MEMKSPKDKLAHFALLIFVTFFSGLCAKLLSQLSSSQILLFALSHGVNASIIKEATQAEANFNRLSDLFNRSWWKTILTKDRFWDFVADGSGIVIGYFLLRSL